MSFNAMKLHNIVDNKHQCDTITVNDLIEKLLKYPRNMPVVGKWDTYGAPIRSVQYKGHGLI